MDALRLSLLLLAVWAQTQLSDGVSYRDVIETEGGSQLYRFHLSEPHKKDLTVAVTTYSGTQPELYMSKTEDVSAAHHQYPEDGEASYINVPFGQLCTNCDYYILVKCDLQCRYRVTAAHDQPIELVPGVALHGQLHKKHTAFYKVSLDPEITKELVVAVTPTSMSMELTLHVLGANDTETPMACTPGWHSGVVCHFEPPLEPEYSFIVKAKTAATYSILMTKESTVVELRTGEPTEGHIQRGKYKYYNFEFDRPEDTIILTLTAMTGDPDLYVSLGKEPTRESYDFSAFMEGRDMLVITEHDRVQKGLSTGNYTVGVYGSSEATFTLLLTYNKGLFVPLTPGIQQSGYVDPGKISLYYQDVPLEEAFNITISVQPSTGLTLFYIKLCKSPLKKCRLTSDQLSDPTLHRSNGLDSMTLSHEHDACRGSSNCRYTVAVVSGNENRAFFHVFASFDDSTVHLLRKGVPMQMTIPAQGLRFFRYDVLDVAASELQVTVTPILGDPDLYGTRNSTANLHNYLHFEKRSTKSLTLPDSVSFRRGDDTESMVDVYYFVVTSLFSLSHFTIIAVENTPEYNSTLLLRAGYPQLDTLSTRPQQHYRIYTFSTDYAPGQEKPIKLTLTPLSGAFELYVDNNATSLNTEQMTFEYIWKLKGARQPNRAYDLVIPTTDKDYKAKSVYLAVVIGREFAENDEASYSIVYRPGGELPSHLQDDIPIRDEVELNAWRFYVFTLFEAHRDITISVTALSGDPDLYVAYNSLPNKTHHDAQSTGFRGELLTIQWEDLKSVCEFPCSLYMAVVGYSAAVYEIQVTTRKDLPVMLALDSPVKGAINKTEYRYYYSVVTSEVDMLVQLHSQLGDADLFVNVIDAGKADVNITNWERPSRNNYMNNSMRIGAFDQVKLDSGLLQSLCVRSCIVLTGVYCSFGDCEYLLYHAQGGMLLMEGSPTQATVATDHMAYFNFYCPRTDAEVMISVTPLNEAAPRIYVSRGEDSRPGPSTGSDWNMTHWQGKPLVLRPTDPEAGGQSMRGSYSIGVTGSTITLSFVISVSLGVAPTQLVRGVIVTGATAANSTSYYFFHSVKSQDVLIRVTPTAGFVTLYASPQRLNDTNDLFPTVKNHIWASSMAGNVHELHISSSDFHFCTGCRIVIAVVALSRNSTYRIVAANLDHITQLSNGIPTQGEVSKGAIVRYSFEVVELKSFDVGLTSLYGDGDLYISIWANVSDTEYIWSSETQNKVDHIRISKSDRRFIMGSYYIAVRGKKSTGFFLTAHMRNSFIHLIDGWPQVYSVRKDDNMLFDFNVNAGQTYACVLRSSSQDLHVYISFQETTETAIIPTDSNSDVSFSGEDFQFEELRFANRSGLPGKYNINVVSDSEAMFKLTCASVTELHVLYAQDTAFAMLDAFMPLRRYLVSAEEASTLEATLESCSGKVELLVSDSFEHVNSDLFPVFPLPDGRIKSVVTKFQGHVYLTAKLKESSPFFEGASYEIRVRITSNGTVHQTPPELYPGKEGVIDWSVASLGRVKLDWSPPVYSDERDLPQNITYKVMITDSKNVTMGTVCGIRAGEIYNMVWEGFTPEAIEDTSVTLEVPLQRRLLINILATVPEESGTQYVAYNSLEVFISSGRGGDLSPLVIGLIVVTATVLLTLLLVYMYRFRKAQRRLEYELSDVRNVASIVSQVPDPERARKARRDVVYSPLQLDTSE